MRRCRSIRGKQMMNPVWVRWTIRLGLGVLAAIVVVAGIATIFFGPRNALVLALILLQPLLGNTRAPSIVAGQLSYGIGGDDLSAFFREKFPLGSDEAIVRATLLRQGFKRPDPPTQCLPHDGVVVLPCPVNDLSRTLKYQWSGFPCGDDVVVWWTASDGGAITDIRGYHTHACL